jgi:hypothetical protein
MQARAESPETFRSVFLVVLVFEYVHAWIRIPSRVGAPLEQLFEAKKKLAIQLVETACHGRLGIVPWPHWTMELFRDINKIWG